MTVIVQPGTDSNGNPQPMVYDQDTGKVIVDSNGFIVSGGQRLVNVPSKADYVSTPKTQTSGIQEAEDYLQLGGEIKLMPGAYPLNAPVQWYKNTIPDDRTGVVDLPPIMITGSGQYPIGNVANPTITGTIIYPTSKFPAGEYMFQFNPYSVPVSGQTYATSVAKGVTVENITFYGAENGTGTVQYASDISGLAIDGATIMRIQSFYCVNSFNFQHVNSVGGNNNIIDCVIYSPQQNGVYNSVGQSYLIGIMLYNGGTTNTTSSYAFTLLGDVRAIGCSIQNYAGNGYYLGGYATVSKCVSAGYTVGLNYFTVDGDYCVISGNTLVAPTNGGSILTIVSGSVNMYGNVITLIKDIGYFVNRTATTIQKRSVIRNNTVHLNGFTFSPYPIGDSSDDGSTLYVMNNGGINPHGVWNISVNPPASGTVYQNNNQFDIEIDLPVYATTAGTAGYVTIAKGASSTPTVIGNQYVSGDTSSTSTQIIRLRVPAGWYYEFTASGVTFGTAFVFAE